MKEANDNRFSFVTNTPVDHPTLENRMPKEDLRLQDAESTNNEHERLIAYWIDYNAPWTELFTKR